MIPQSIRPFLTRLREETDRNNLEWLVGSGDRAFSCAHKKYNIHIWSGFDENTEQPFVSFHMSGPKEFRFSVDGNENDYDTMLNLLSSIEVNASKFDDDAMEEFFS